MDAGEAAAAVIVSQDGRCRAGHHLDDGNVVAPDCNRGGAVTGRPFGSPG